MAEKVGRARAHTNIALIKYWGKRDKELFLPMNSSLSLTLEAFYTDTQVVFDKTLTEDSFYLNGQWQNSIETAKISQFLDLFRVNLPNVGHARIDSYNFVPTAAGLASSASAYAALAMAINQALNLNWGRQTLSTYARRGSGSSTRSLFGGFVEWSKGTGSADSLAYPIDDATWDIGMLVLLVNAEKKAVASRVGMEHTVATSPFYEAWVTSAQEDLEAIKLAIEGRDFPKLGAITEHNGMKMHATTLSAKPPFTYWNAETVRLQEVVRQVREETGLSAYMTMDAGPNLKLLCKLSEMSQLIEALAQHFPREQMIASRPGPAAYYLDKTAWEASKEEFYGRKK